MAHKNENWVGGSFHNITILATVNEIISVLGEADCQDNTGRDKTNFDWNGETESGIGFTVYDWKEYRPIGMDEKISFHIGGKDFMETSTAKQELLRDIEDRKLEASGLDKGTYDAINELNEIQQDEEA